MKQRTEYAFQKFILESDATNVEFEKITIDNAEDVPDCGLEYNIFDFNGYFRKIALSTLDSRIDTEKDFNNFLNKIKDIDCLYIADDRPESENPIYQAFSLSHKQKLVRIFLDKNIKVKMIAS